MGIGITSEQTEKERQRKALEDAYQAFRTENSAKTDFLSSRSHDIRTPMNAIVGMSKEYLPHILEPFTCADEFFALHAAIEAACAGEAEKTK